MNKHALLAISKAQKAIAKTPPDLSLRVTALEMENKSLLEAIELVNNDLIVMQKYFQGGFSGSINIIESIDFLTQKCVNKTLLYKNGILMEQ